MADKPPWETILDALQSAIDKNNDQAAKIILYLLLSTRCPVEHEREILDAAEKACSWLGRNNDGTFNQTQVMGIILKRDHRANDFFEDLASWGRQEGFTM